MNEPNCPYCGAEVDTTDFFEFDDSTETDCPECEKEFHVEREVEVTYKITRLECEEGEHEYDEWVRIDVDQGTLDRWSKDPIMENHSKEDPYSYYSRDCNNCDDTDYSENMPLGTELAQDQIRSRYDD